jgi:hypothetical protein
VRRDPAVAVPDGISPLIGYREWDLVDDWGNPRLVSLFRPTAWPFDRPLRAQCLRYDRWAWWLRNVAHPVPTEGCGCGIHAHLEPSFEPAKGNTERRVVGVVRGWGHFVEGTTGWRVETASVAALVRPADTALRWAVHRASERYGVPILDVPEAFEADPPRLEAA